MPAGRLRVLPGRQARQEQVEYGLLTDPEGRPVAVRVFAGNTADPTAFPEAVEMVRGTFGHRAMIMVGDRGMITSARIRACGSWGHGVGHLPARPGDPEAWPTTGRCSCRLFDQQDLAEITSPEFPGERLIACRNPLLAAERARKREDLLAATEADLAKIAAQAARRALKGQDKIGLRAGRVINKHKVAKHFILDIGEGRLTWRRDQASHRRRGRPGRDLRHPHPASPRTAWTRAGTVAAYKDLPTSSATSAPSRPTTWTCAPSTTGSRTGSGPTC